jgi:hypothetical protein
VLPVVDVVAVVLVAVADAVVELPAVPLVEDAALLRLVAAHLQHSSRNGILSFEKIGDGIGNQSHPRFVSRGFSGNCETGRS